jgi:hypothetical protein
VGNRKHSNGHFGSVNGGEGGIFQQIEQLQASEQRIISRQLMISVSAKNTCCNIKLFGFSVTLRYRLLPVSKILV